MQTVDFIALGIILLAALLGLLLGFGKCLKIFTSGIIGVIISVVVTYFIMGVVASWGFVQAIMEKFTEALVNNGSGFCTFLLNIGIESIVLAIALFLIIQIIRIIIVNVIKGIAEADNVVVKVINKFLGLVFALAVFAMLALIVFQIVYMIGGDTAESFKQYLTGAFKLDVLFENNPLHVIADKWINT